MLTAEATHQDLAKGFTIGMRFHSAPVVRLADAKPVQLGHAARADGAWRIYAFADASGERLRELWPPSWRTRRIRRSAASPRKGADIDSVIDVRAVFQQGHRDLKVEELPSILLPRKGCFGLIDYEKAYSPRPQERPGHLRPARHRPRAGRDGRRPSRPVRCERAAAGRASTNSPTSSAGSCCRPDAGRCGQPSQTNALSIVEGAGALALALSGAVPRNPPRPCRRVRCRWLTAFGGGTCPDVLLDRRPSAWVSRAASLRTLMLVCLLATLLLRA